jgi:hypothetical protein
MVQRVTIMPNTWAGTMPLLLMILKDGKPPGQEFAEAELMRLARATDANNEDCSRPPEVLIKGDDTELLMKKVEEDYDE